VTRGSSPLSWSAGDIVLCGPTAQTMSEFVQASQAQSNSPSYAPDTGSANAYAIAPSPAISGTPAAGTLLYFKAIAANTGASTITVNGTSYPLTGSNGALAANEIVANGNVKIAWNSTYSGFELVTCTRAEVAVPAATSSGHAIQAGQVVSGTLGIATAGGTANAITASFATSPTAYASGQPFTIIAAAANTGAMTAVLTLGGTVQASVPIVKGNNQALVAGDNPGAGYPGEYNYSPTYGALVMQNPATGVITLGLQANGITAAITTSTLAAGVAGGTVLANSASAIALTLPAASAVAAGKRIEFLNINTGIATITRAGSDTLITGSTTSTTLALGNGDTLTLESNGASGWYAVAGSAQIGLSASFASVKSSAGYQKLPSGLIIQWQSGTTSASAGTGLTHNFPIAFPNAILGVTITAFTQTVGAATPYTISALNPTLVSFASQASASSLNFFAVAIGN